MLIKYCKIFLVGIIAIIFCFASVTNLTDPQPNLIFLQHILSMDTTGATASTSWRAITSPTLQVIAYGIVVCWEGIAGIICLIASTSLFLNRKDPVRFKNSKAIAVLGLTLGFAVYTLIFIGIGSEWFQMWKSKIYNAKASAGIYSTLVALVMLIVLSADE